jgi:hypothetical protein
VLFCHLATKKKTHVTHTKECYEKNPPKSPDFENIFPEIVI